MIATEWFMQLWKTVRRRRLPTETPRYLRFADLKERGLVTNWVQLGRLKRDHGFPPGKLLGVTRIWTEEEIDAYFEELPTERSKTGD